MAPPLEVLADLRLAVDGEPVDVRGTGDHIVVDLPSVRAGRRLLNSGPFATHPGRTTHQIHEALQEVELSAEVRLKGAPVAHIGTGAQPGMLGKMLGLEGAEVRLARPLRTAARRRPILTATVILGLLVFIGWLLLRDSTG